MFVCLFYRCSFLSFLFGKIRLCLFVVVYVCLLVLSLFFFVIFVWKNSALFVRCCLCLFACFIVVLFCHFCLEKFGFVCSLLFMLVCLFHRCSFLSFLFGKIQTYKRFKTKLIYYDIDNASSHSCFGFLFGSCCSLFLCEYFAINESTKSGRREIVHS